MVKNLKKLRMEKKVSQQQLASIIGISQQSINKYENHNIEPEISILIALSDYFQTSVDYLVGHTEIRHAIEPTSPFDLNEEEAHLLEGYRTLSKKEKESVLLIIENYPSHTS